MLSNLEDVLKSILNKLEYQNELLQLSISNLKTKKAVAECINKSTTTVDNYIKNGTLEKDKHYIINTNGKIEFIPSSIIEFKMNGLKKVETKESLESLVHLSVSSILKGLNHG